jgi:hypothetical protein
MWQSWSDFCSRLWMRIRTFALLSLIGAVVCAQVEATAPPVQIEMRHVDLHLTPDITLEIRHLSGTLHSNNERAPNLDDKTSYHINVTAAEVAIGLPSLNATIVRALGGGRSNVRRLQLTIEDGTLRQKGTINKAIDIPFNAKGAVGVTPDGRIRVHTESVKGYGMPLKPLMKIFGVEMDNLLRVQPVSGVTVAGNDLILDPSHLLPPPLINGRVTAVRVEDASLVQVFGTGAARSLEPPASGANHILWRGGQISFGKLTMSETDLEVIDDDPRDPLEFSADAWNRQLTAGYSKITTRRGLQAHVPDFDDLNRRATPPARR